MTQQNHRLADVAALATLAFGGLFLWKKFHHAADPPHPDDVMLCLQSKPTWGLPQCQKRLQDLKTAAAAARKQIAAITAGRNAYLELGDAAALKAIDQAAAPWQMALYEHQQDYFNLTGSQL